MASLCTLGVVTWAAPPLTTQLLCNGATFVRGAPARLLGFVTGSMAGAVGGCHRAQSARCHGRPAGMAARSGLIYPCGHGQVAPPTQPPHSLRSHPSVTCRTAPVFSLGCCFLSLIGFFPSRASAPLSAGRYGSPDAEVERRPRLPCERSPGGFGRVSGCPAPDGTHVQRQDLKLPTARRDGSTDGLFRSALAPCG